MGYVTRTMTRDEVAGAIDWAAQEGWNPGRHDAATFHAADPQGFFLGELDGEPIASISVVKYGAGFAFLGLYIVRPEFRGRGHGWALWQHGRASAAGRQVGLDRQARMYTGTAPALPVQRLYGVTTFELG